MNDAALIAWSTVAATTVTAIATGVLAWFTWAMARATRAMADQTNSPHVNVSFEPSRWSLIHIDMVIENTGSGTAYDVRLQFTPPLHRDKGEREQKALEFPDIALLKPGQRIANFIGNFNSYANEQYTVSISWARQPGGAIRQAWIQNVDLFAYREVHVLGSGDPSVVIANETKKLREAIQALAGNKRLKVDVFSSSDREKDRRKQELWMKQAREEQDKK